MRETLYVQLQMGDRDTGWVDVGEPLEVPRAEKACDEALDRYVAHLREQKVKQELRAVSETGKVIAWWCAR